MLVHPAMLRWEYWRLVTTNKRFLLLPHVVDKGLSFSTSTKVTDHIQRTTDLDGEQAGRQEKN